MENKVSFVLYIDYLSNENNVGFEYRPMKSVCLADAIEEAEKVYDSDSMYLIRIMQRITSKSRKVTDSISYNAYKAILCKRSEKCGWHKNEEYNGEIAHFCRRYHNKESNSYWFTCSVEE